MIQTLYVENGIQAHPRARDIRERFPEATVITCDRYGEIFNRKAQDFRLQKQRPALILAEKFDHFVLPVPSGYGIGARHNYYFSHMLNCLYDCRYCFLQGMYRSAHYVLFVNYESFAAAIAAVAAKHAGTNTHFFSGYDCDSLALEPVTGFVSSILPLFAGLPSALLELRTKSTQIRTLLKGKPLENCVVAYSLTPEAISQALEHRAPAVQKRLQAMRQLQQAGWQIGLRFDPLIYHSGFKESYRQLFNQVFSSLDAGLIHSVSIGDFRLPKAFFQKIFRLYPEELLFASPLEDSRGGISYKQEIRREMLDFCRDEISGHISPQKLFPCVGWSP